MNASFHHFDRVFFDHDFCGSCTETAIITRNIVIFLGFEFVARKANFFSVDDDDIITTVNVWCPCWFVLTS